MKSLKQSLSYKIISIILIVVLAIQSCHPFTSYLSDDEMTYLYMDQQELQFLENNSDTILLTAKTYFKIADQGSTFGFPDFNKKEYGSSEIVFNDSLIYSFKILIYASNNYFRIRMRCENCLDQSLLSEYLYPDDMNIDNIQILDHTYTHYFKITADSTTSLIKELYFAKGYGLLRLEMEDGYTLELIPEEEE